MEAVTRVVSDKQNALLCVRSVPIIMAFRHYFEDSPCTQTFQVTVLNHSYGLICCRSRPPPNRARNGDNADECCSCAGNRLFEGQTFQQDTNFLDLLSCPCPILENSYMALESELTNVLRTIRGNSQRIVEVAFNLDDHKVFVWYFLLRNRCCLNLV